MSFATAIVLAAEEGDSGADLLIPDTAELIAGIVAFAIVFFFVWLFARPMIAETLEKRRQAIAGRLEEAERSKTEAESLLEDYRRQLAEAREEGNRIIEESRGAGEAMRSEIVARAERDADEIRARARQEAATERERARAALRREVTELSLDVAERVVAGGLDRSGQRALVDRYIEELGGVGSDR